MTGERWAASGLMWLTGWADRSPLPGPAGVAGALAGVAVRGPRRAPTGGARRRIEGARVVDLSAMWAGPLCASVLGMAGADVIKVEDPRRPDGARFGPPEFFDLLHAGHRSVVLALES